MWPKCDDSWKARMIVLKQALYLICVDLPTVVALFLVSATALTQAICRLRVT